MSMKHIEALKLALEALEWAVWSLSIYVLLKVYGVAFV